MSQDATGGRTVTGANTGGLTDGTARVNTTLSPPLVTTENQASALYLVTDGYNIVQVV